MLFEELLDVGGVGLERALVKLGEFKRALRLQDVHVALGHLHLHVLFGPPELAPRTGLQGLGGLDARDDAPARKDGKRRDGAVAVGAVLRKRHGHAHEAHLRRLLEPEVVRLQVHARQVLALGGAHSRIGRLLGRAGGFEHPASRERGVPRVVERLGRERARGQRPGQKDADQLLHITRHAFTSVAAAFVPSSSAWNGKAL